MRHPFLLAPLLDAVPASEADRPLVTSSAAGSSAQMKSRTKVGH